MSVISSKTSKIVWGRAAGRCQYRNCGDDLIGDLVSNRHNIAFGEQAHVIGAKEKGPRGDPILSQELQDDPDNILLLCKKHHRIIDEQWRDGSYRVDELRSMKRDHESIVRAALSSYPPSRAHSVIFSARVGEIEIGIDPNEARAAMVAAGIVPYEVDPIDLSISGLSLPDDTETYWLIQIKELRQKVAERIHGRIDRGEVKSIALFAFAPMPLLVELGSMLPEHWSVSVFQLHREPKGWFWANDRDPLSFSVRRGAPSTKHVALKVEVSARIADDRVTAVMPEGTAIWSVGTATPGNDVVRRPEDLSSFRVAFRRALREIREAHPDAAAVSVFPAMPVSCAVEIGRARQPKADFPLVIFDQVAGRGFEKRNRIG